MQSKTVKELESFYNTLTTKLAEVADQDVIARDDVERRQFDVYEVYLKAKNRDPEWTHRLKHCNRQFYLHRFTG